MMTQLSSLPPARSPADCLQTCLDDLLPHLLSASLAVKAFVGRWQLLRETLISLQSLLVSISALPSSSLSHPLFSSILPSVSSSLTSLLSLSSLCSDASLPSGRLHLLSDLHIASSSLSLHLHHLSLILSSNPSSHTPTAPVSGNAIVLQVPAASTSRPDITLFIRDVFARLSIGNHDLKLKALESLLEFLSSDPSKLAPIVAADGDVSALLRFLDVAGLRDPAVSAVSLLATASPQSRRVVFDEGGLGPLLRLLDSGPAAAKDHAAAAVEAISGDPNTAWAIPAYSGVPVLIGACRAGSGSPSLRAVAASALENVVSISDGCAGIVEEGGIPVLADLLSSGTIESKRSAAICLWSIASMGDREARAAVHHDAGLPLFLELLRDASDHELQDHILKVIQAIVDLPAVAKELSSSPPFFADLAIILSRSSNGSNGSSAGGGNISAAALIAELTPGEDTKRALAPCMPSLVKMMEMAKPTSAQESAAAALCSLLAVKGNRKELLKDEKSLLRLVQMLDPRNEEVLKRFPVTVLLAITADAWNGARKKLTDAGACQHLQKLAGDDVPGAKKLLQRICGGRLKSLFSLGRTN